MIIPTLVHVAPAPVLPRLERVNQGVVAGLGVSGSVPVRRVVAAADVAAFEADAQVQPHAPLAEAVLAAVGPLGQLTHRDGVEMGAARHFGVSFSEGLTLCGVEEVGGFSGSHT